MFRSYDHLQGEMYYLGSTQLTTDPDGTWKNCIETAYFKTEVCMYIH
jgi:hypothetical protein